MEGVYALWLAASPKQQIAEPCSSRRDEDLLEDFDSSDEGNINSEDEMSEEQPQVLTNGLVCEFCNKFKDLTWNEIKFKGEFCVSKADCDGQDLSVYTKIERTFKKWKSLRGKKAKEFINTEFKPPSSPVDYLAFVVKDTPHKKELKQNLLKTRKENRGLKRKLEDSFKEIKSMDNEMNQLSYQYEKTFVVVPELERDEEIKKQKELFQITFHEARMKRKSKASKTKLDLYLKDPSLLVGKRIKHLVQDDKNSKPEWYDATVTKIEKTNENPIKIVFEIIYDIDGEDEQFNYPLLTDLNNKKLVIL